MSIPPVDFNHGLLAARAKVSLRPALPFPLTLLSLPHLVQRPLNTFASAV